MAEQRLDQLSIFLSYAWADGREHAQRFAEELPRRSMRFAPWYDARIRSDEPFYPALQTALSTADVLLVVLTQAWPMRRWCRRELLLAERKRIRVILAQMDPDVEPDLMTVDQNTVNFVHRPEEAWVRLVGDLIDQAAPDRVLRSLDKVSGDAAEPTDGRHAVAAQELAERRSEETRRVADLAGAEQRTRERVEAAIGRPDAVGDAVRADRSMRFVNDVPPVPKTGFHDRVAELAKVDDALAEPGVRVVVIAGDGGIGKTAMVAEIRERLAGGAFRTRADAFVYLSARGYRPISAETLLGDLARTLDDPDTAGRLARRLRSRRTWHDRVSAVLDTLRSRAVVVAIDDVGDLLDDAGHLRDHDLREVVDDLIGRDGHLITFLFTDLGRFRVRRAVHESRVRICALDEGLPPTETAPFLESLDEDGLLDISAIPRDDLDRLAILSDGSPRFLELMYCLLRGDPDLAVADALNDITALQADGPVEPITALLQLVLSQLDSTECRVVQALAVFGRPVRPEAVDHLLQHYVAGIESEPILDRLAGRRLVRRDIDRYFLPPTPDVHDVLATIPAAMPGATTRSRRQFTRPALQLEAAGFYAKVAAARSRPATSIEDLQPRLHEIELRMRAGSTHPAVDLMCALDDDFLTRWGQSGILTPWRQELHRTAPPDRWWGRNLSYLASAQSNEEDHDGARAAALRLAIDQPWARHRDADRLQLSVQLADTLMVSGLLTEAERRYGEVAAEAEARGMTAETATALATRAMCLARVGRFRPAADQFARARELADRLEDDSHAEVQALILLNEGWMLGQQGAGPEAVDRIGRGLRMAIAMNDLVRQGQFLDARAALFCDRRDPAAAVPPAIEAAEIGLRTGNAALGSVANENLALAYLLADDVQKACAAAEAAVRQQSTGIRALGTWTVMGVVRYRDDDRPGARLAFHTACTEAWLRLTRAPEEYSAHHAVGLALTGLELCREPHRLDRATEAFRAARRITGAAGAQRRVLAQLDLFGLSADADVLETARQAVRESALDRDQ